VVVLEDGEQVGYGSGVILSKNGATYYALTNRHVASREQDYVVRTVDGEVHRVDNVRTVSNDVDLAVVEFTSEENYSIARISPAQLSEASSFLFRVGLFRIFKNLFVSLPPVASQDFYKNPILGIEFLTLM
jgi:S1-C subfamily serine protease